MCVRVIKINSLEHQEDHFQNKLISILLIFYSLLNWNIKNKKYLTKFTDNGITNSSSVEIVCGSEIFKFLHHLNEYKTSVNNNSTVYNV